MFGWLKKLMFWHYYPLDIVQQADTKAVKDRPAVIDRGVTAMDGSPFYPTIQRTIPGVWFYRHDGRGNYSFLRYCKGSTVTIRYQIGEKKYKKTVTI